MSQSEKSAYFQALKAKGVPFPKHYREYSTEELKQAYDMMVEAGEAEPLNFQEPEPPPAEEPPPSDFFNLPPSATQPQRSQPPVMPKDPGEMAGQRQNSQGGEPIRTDEFGRVWWQEEIRKPAFPKPRGRRVLTYMETGTKTVQARSGDYVESFEVAGDAAPRVAEVKITLPSYQVGIYSDPRFPFRIHCYNDKEGFDLFEVQEYYGGAELVPAEAKRMYVENDLCYDIRTTVRAIESEYRRLQLAGKVE
jgi:hypothetical protein